MHHVSGVLKVAPEHISPRVLKNMRKPAKEVFDRFSAEYSRMNKKLGKKPVSYTHLDVYKRQ